MSPPLVEGQRDDAADLSFRLRGGRALAVSPVCTQAFARPRRRRILLIHGFNVEEVDGIGSMAELRRNVRRRCPSLGKDSLTVTWPGDEAFHRGGAAAYPRLKDVAVETGAKLFEFVINEYNWNGPEEIVIVAHSLGCRVTLEFLQRLQRAQRPKRLKHVVVVLMAAAVPIELDSLIRTAVANCDYVVVLHSHEDWVLRLWFRIGQTRAGEGDMPEAVGLKGLPADPGWTEERQMIGFGHSDYWTSDETAEVVCLALERFLPNVVLRKDLERTRVLPAPPGLPSRDLLALHQLARLADAVRQ